MAVLETFAHFGHQQKQVGILQGSTHKAHHLLMQFVGGVDDAGGIGVDNLEIIAVDYAHHTLARGLGLAGDNA